MSIIRESVRRVLKRVSRLYMLAAMLCIFGIVFLVTGDVTRRAFTDQGIPASIEISEFLIAIGVAFGFAWAQIQKQHISIDFVFRYFSQRGQALITVFDWALSFFFISMLTYASWLIAWERYLSEETKFAGTLLIPVWPARFLFALGVTLLWVILLSDVISAIGSLVKRGVRS